MIKYKNNNRGLVKMILLIVVVLLLLAYFRVNLRNIVSSDVWMENWDFVKGILVYVWENFLKVPIMFIFGKLFGGQS